MSLEALYAVCSVWFIRTIVHLYGGMCSLNQIQKSRWRHWCELTTVLWKASDRQTTMFHLSCGFGRMSDDHCSQMFRMCTINNRQCSIIALRWICQRMWLTGRWRVGCIVEVGAGLRGFTHFDIACMQLLWFLNSISLYLCRELYLLADCLTVMCSLFDVCPAVKSSCSLPRNLVSVRLHRGLGFQTVPKRSYWRTSVRRRLLLSRIVTVMLTFSVTVIKVLVVC